jgi:hypothetical protein
VLPSLFVNADPQRGGLCLRFPALFLLLALALPSAARAEVASRAGPAQPVTIAVFGDSLAEGLWGSLYRRFARERGIRIVNATRASTGFNADAYDEALDRLLARGPIDLLIVQTGANDRQRALALDGRRSAAFGSGLWHAFYSQRLTYFLARAQRNGVRVLWVGLPVMRDAPFDRGMRLISQVHRDHAQRHGAVFLDIFHATADAEGAFVEKLPIGAGRVRRVRHEDGVHFWEFGYDRVAAEVLATIRARYPRLLPEGRARAELPSHKP